MQHIWGKQEMCVKIKSVSVQTQLNSIHLTFVFPCIVSVITVDNQQDATILIYLLLISSKCFGWCFRPSLGAYHCNYSCPPMDSCSYSDMLLMMGENIARNI